MFNYFLLLSCAHANPKQVQLLVDAQAAAVFEEKVAKKLMDRISTTPKSQPKSAVPNKSNGKDQGAKRGGKRGSRGGSNTARPTKKTAEELDLEMADYWESGNAAGAEAGGDNNQAASGAAQPATNGDANMDDEILVCIRSSQSIYKHAN